MFNEQTLIEDSLNSLLGVVDEFRIYDGRYKGFACPCGKEHDNSCDTTEAVIMKFTTDNFTDQDGAVVKLRELPTMWEFDKRQRMLDDLAPGDTAIVVDADEMFIGGQRGIDELRSFARAVPKVILEEAGPWKYSPFKIGRFTHLSLEGAHTWMHGAFVKTPGLHIVNGGHLDYTWADDEGQWTPAQSYNFIYARFAHMKNNGIGAGFRPKAREKAGNDYAMALMNGKVSP